MGGVLAGLPARQYTIRSWIDVDTGACAFVRIVQAAAAIAGTRVVRLLEREHMAPTGRAVDADVTPSLLHTDRFILTVAVTMTGART